MSLTPELRRFVEVRVRTGGSASARDLVRAALRLLEARVGAPISSTDAVRAEIELGLEQLRRGESVDGDAFFEELRERRAARG